MSAQGGHRPPLQQKLLERYAVVDEQVAILRCIRILETVITEAVADVE